MRCQTIAIDDDAQKMNPRLRLKEQDNEDEIYDEILVDRWEGDVSIESGARDSKSRGGTFECHKPKTYFIYL